MNFKKVLVNTLGVISVFGGYAVVFAVTAAVFSLLYMLLWNWTAPLAWAGAPQLTLLQAFGTWLSLIVLIGMALDVLRKTFKPDPKPITSLSGSPVRLIVAVLVVLGVLSITSLILMALWNWLAPVYWVQAPRLGFLPIWLGWSAVVVVSQSIQWLLSRSLNRREPDVEDP